MTVQIVVNQLMAIGVPIVWLAVGVACGIYAHVRWWSKDPAFHGMTVFAAWFAVVLLAPSSLIEVLRDLVDDWRRKRRL